MKSPLYSLRAWLRVLLRVMALFVIFDAAFITLRPFDRLQLLSIYGTIVPYHTRLTTVKPDMADQLVPIDVLLKAHEIAVPKRPDEYRVIVLGDSGVNGVGNLDSETISAYLTASNVSIEGKRIRAYNLGNPYPSVMRDLVIADAAMQYQPDMVVWFVTQESFENSPDTMLSVSQVRMTQLTSQYHLDDINARLYGHAADTWWQRSILVKRTDILQWLRFQTFVLHEPAPYQIAALTYLTHHPTIEVSFSAGINPSWAALIVLPKITSIPILIVNEPILIMPPNTSGPYKDYVNLFVPHYEDYRALLAQFCAEHSLWCLDIGELIPANQFTDNVLHRTAAANVNIVAHVVQAIHARFDTPVF